MNTAFRTESDSMGQMQVPADALYGAQTARAIENFPISDRRFPRSFIRALGLIKKHAAATNASLGLLPEHLAVAIQSAAQEVLEGKWDNQFPLDIFQTGSGTSTNMNANEVIANRAGELLGGTRGDRVVHPNDHVNRGQSSNDVIPSCIHIAALEAIRNQLLPALRELEQELLARSRDFYPILKIGRTHLQDATPIRVGQEFGGYSVQISKAISWVDQASAGLEELALGGTAVGTGLNTHPDFARKAIQAIADETKLAFREARDHFAAQAGIDACVQTSGALKALATVLIKIANDIRLLGSGPRCGLGELQLPATQPGSSIMPGKVNPVMCEMLIQVAAQVICQDATVGFCATQGYFELNTMLPVAAWNLLSSIELLTRGAEVFSRRCIAGLQVNPERCRSNIEQSLAMATVLAPVIGYDAAAAIAKEAYASGRTVREVAREKTALQENELERLLDPKSQTRPSSAGSPA